MIESIRIFESPEQIAGANRNSLQPMRSIVSLVSPAGTARVVAALLSATVGLLTLTVTSPSTAEAETLRVLCYNIHYGQGNDGRYDIERLAAVIKKSNPDLVALQEVDVGVKRSGRLHQAQRLSELTGMPVRFGPTQHYEGGLFGNAVLTKLPILDVLIQPLPYTESTPEKVTYPRAAIAVTVRLPSGRPLRFISTHFQHNMPDDRIAEAKAVNSFFAQDETVATILAGDMNAVPGSEPIRILLQQWSGTADNPPTPTAPSKNPTSRIDYIFYRPQSSIQLKHSEVISEPMASDHCPVLAVFELP